MESKIWPAFLGPEPFFSPGSVAHRLETGRRKIELFLQAGLIERAVKVVGEMDRACSYLKMNYPREALARGPVPAQGKAD